VKLKEKWMGEFGKALNGGLLQYNVPVSLL